MQGLSVPAACVIAEVESGLVYVASLEGLSRLLVLVHLISTFLAAFADGSAGSLFSFRTAESIDVRSEISTVMQDFSHHFPIFIKLEIYNTTLCPLQGKFLVASIFTVCM